MNDRDVLREICNRTESTYREAPHVAGMLLSWRFAPFVVPHRFSVGAYLVEPFRRLVVPLPAETTVLMGSSNKLHHFVDRWFESVWVQIDLSGQGARIRDCGATDTAQLRGNVLPRGIGQEASHWQSLEDGDTIRSISPEGTWTFLWPR